jgi:hypothetical protein
MKIPKKIEIIIQNQHNEIVEKEIVFGIKIYKSKDSYLNFSPLKTEENGKKIILQNQIFEYLTSENNFDDFESNKIEIEIWEAKIINDIFESVKTLGSKTEEQLKKELVNLGFDEEFAQKHSLNSYKKLQKDFDFWKQFFEVENKNIKFIEDKISDFWIDEKEKKYIFTIITVRKEFTFFARFFFTFVNCYIDNTC